MNILERLNNSVKHDMWSDLVTKGFDSVGVTRDTRNLIQPVVDKAKSLLPKGGVIPNSPNVGANSSIPSGSPSDAYDFVSANWNGIPIWLLLAGAVAAVVHFGRK